MSAVAFSSDDFSSARRRTAVRRLALVTPAGLPPLAAVSVPVSVPFPTAPKDYGSSWRPSNTAIAVLLVLALHVAVIYYLRHRPADIVPPAAIAPVAVDLVQQPVEPPKPPPPQLKKPVTPPPPPPPAAPKINLPPPPPAALPAVAAPAAPVVQAPPPAPPAPVAPAPVKETPAEGYAGYLNNPQPGYPQFAQDQGWEGRVLLHVHVLPSGHADHVDIKQSSGHKILDQISADTVLKRWAFMPAKRGDTAVDGWVDVPIDFKLSN